MPFLCVVSRFFGSNLFFAGWVIEYWLSQMNGVIFMEQHIAEYGRISLAAFLANVRNITIPVEYVREDNGHWSCWTKHDIPGTIQTFGVGDNFNEAVDDYVDALKEIAECIYEDDLPEDDISVEWLAKILMTSKEELKKCLDGKISYDS